LTPNNNVFNIEIQKKLSDSVGVNKFTHFDLNSGKIANMQFGTLNILANLVDNRININGTVNAFRNGKIGGNLYFFSPEGIAVGASGVINAGSFTGIAADKAYFEELSKMTDAAKSTASDESNENTNIVNDSKVSLQDTSNLLTDSIFDTDEFDNLDYLNYFDDGIYKPRVCLQSNKK
jgi:filamentous hemagglutinin family protein